MNYFNLDILFPVQLQVPSLADGIRSSELIVGVYGAEQTLASLRGGCSPPEGEGGAVDAFIVNGVISFIDRSQRESMSLSNAN